jgi:hypothetical protein
VCVFLPFPNQAAHCLPLLVEYTTAVTLSGDCYNYTRHKCTVTCSLWSTVGKSHDYYTQSQSLIHVTKYTPTLADSFPDLFRITPPDLRTFAVIPLTEDCGLIEWVPSTTGLRHVVQKLYVDDGVYHKRTLVEVKEMHERLKATPTTWMSEILKKFPPVFHRWFLNRWKDRPAAWHGTRTAFAHTAAVWSMVGHVVGLGDRHGENILLDQVRVAFPKLASTFANTDTFLNPKP